MEKKFAVSPQYFLFGSIIIVALFFRFFLLSSIPPSPSLDEATIGWNAFSLLLTGHDEYGYHLPILLRAYDDYRPALYVYFVIPFIKFFGLNVLSVRLPSAILSAVTVIATYFFTITLLSSYKYKKWVGLLAMFFLSISPFHIYISRLGHEVNPGLTFAFLGALFFLLAFTSQKSWMLVLWAVCWAGAFYTYQSEKVFIPLLFVVLIAVFWKKVWEKRKIFSISILLMTLLSFPIILSSFSPQALIRLKGTSVFTNNPLYMQSAQALLTDKQNHNYFGEIIHNRRLVSVEIFFSNYFSHYNPLWWIANAGDEQFKMPGLGLSYWWELPLLGFGIIFFLKNTVPLSVKVLPFAWVFISFIAPGITTAAPHAMRAYNILPIPQFLEAYGLAETLHLLKKFSKKMYLSVGIGMVMIILVALSIEKLSYDYFVRFPAQDSYEFEYALTRAMQYVVSHKNDYQHIVVSNINNAYQSYMFYLFVSNYNPIIYAQRGGTVSGGFSETHRIGKIIFQPIQTALTHDSLYIGNPEEKPLAGKTLATFRNLDGKVALVAFTK